MEGGREGRRGGREGGEGGKGIGEGREEWMDRRTDGGRKSVDCAPIELTRQILTPEKLIEVMFGQDIGMAVSPIWTSIHVQ